MAITAWPTAYVLNGPKWATRTVDYYINPANNDVSAAAAEAAIQVGAAAWGSQSNADFRFYYMGRTSATTVGNNGKNEVFFRNVSAGTVVAETYWWADASDRLIDADILIYDGGILFFTGEQWLRRWPVPRRRHRARVRPRARPRPQLGSDSDDVSQRDLVRERLEIPQFGRPRRRRSVVSAIRWRNPQHRTVADNQCPCEQHHGCIGNVSDIHRERDRSAGRQPHVANLVVVEPHRTIGVGGTISSVLPAGTHVVTATVSDNGGLTTAKQVTVTVTVTVGGGTSPDQTRLPPASQIVDASSSIWTIAGMSILRNGQQTGGLGTIITWCGGQIHVMGVDNQWWRWTGGGWSPVGTTDPCGGAAPAPPPPQGTSPDGTRLPPASQIVDATGGTWTIAGVSILRNGQQTGGLGTIITWCGGQIHVMGVDNQWWRWIGGGWSPVGQPIRAAVQHRPHRRARRRTGRDCHLRARSLTRAAPLGRLPACQSCATGSKRAAGARSSRGAAARSVCWE